MVPQVTEVRGMITNLVQQKSLSLWKAGETDPAAFAAMAILGTGDSEVTS
jgi:hypothetical protein